MSDYPNMSYCAFSNTVLAMKQVLSALVEAVEDGPEAVQEFMEDLGMDEARALRQLTQLSQDFAELAKELNSMTEKC